jgi:hypothetical protein
MNYVIFIGNWERLVYDAIVQGLERSPLKQEGYGMSFADIIFVSSLVFSEISGGWWVKFFSVISKGRRVKQPTEIYLPEDLVPYTLRRITWKYAFWTVYITLCTFYWG